LMGVSGFMPGRQLLPPCRDTVLRTCGGIAVVPQLCPDGQMIA